MPRRAPGLRVFADATGRDGRGAVDQRRGVWMGSRPAQDAPLGDRERNVPCWEALAHSLLRWERSVRAPNSMYARMRGIARRGGDG